MARIQVMESEFQRIQKEEPIKEMIPGNIVMTDPCVTEH
jgi:hypothetical protein